jgi:cyanophycin synthetase
MTESQDRVARTNAKETDAFDIFNMRHYLGPNPDLSCEAIVFDFKLTGEPEPPMLEELRAEVVKRLPELDDESINQAQSEGSYSTSDQTSVIAYGTLFGSVVSLVNRLDMNLHTTKWNLKKQDDLARVAFHVIHKKTSWDVVYFVWDWFEYICSPRDNDFDYDARFAELQESFSNSVFGGPTTYSLIRAAYLKHIPVTYLWDEGLVQYGYGKNMVRGMATTFCDDSHIDSDLTCRKDDCKAFLSEYGFPVPGGDVVYDLEDAFDAAEEIGYPVVCKPVVGHKGIGVTANIENEEQLESAFAEAVKAVPEGDSPAIIVEAFISGADHRILCVDGEFIAAIKREAAYVVGDDQHTIGELIAKENDTPNRAGTATSPLGKILEDDVMHRTLAEQDLTVDSVPRTDEKIYLREVANLSLGGVSENVTDLVHPDVIALSRAISQHFKLTVFALDIITDDIANSWKPEEGEKRANFGIIEINAAPGIYMHLKPAIGKPVDVPSRIIDTFFYEGKESRVPILTFNRLMKPSLRRIIDYIMHHNIRSYPAGVCTDGLFLKKHELPVNPDYNANMRNVLRNPRVDMLLAEMPVDVYEYEGMYYDRSDLLVLEDPSDVELTLTEDVVNDATIMIRKGKQVEIRRSDEEPEFLEVEFEDEFFSLVLREIHKHFGVH